MQNDYREINMLQIILNYFAEYIGYYIGGVIQIVFILLPVLLKNWDDDSINATTYIAFQILVACIIFIFAPWLFELRPLPIWCQVLIIVSTAFISLFRTIHIIPFEHTEPLKLTGLQYTKIAFAGFYTSEKREFLESLDFKNVDAMYRYNEFREKLARLRKEQSEDDDD